MWRWRQRCQGSLIDSRYYFQRSLICNLNNKLTNYHMDNHPLQSMFWWTSQMFQPFYGKSRRYNRDNHWQRMENHSSFLPGWCIRDQCLNLHGCDMYYHRSYEMILFVYQKHLSFTFDISVRYSMQSKEKFFLRENYMLRKYQTENHHSDCQFVWVRSQLLSKP